MSASEPPTSVHLASGADIGVLRAMLDDAFEELRGKRDGGAISRRELRHLSEIGAPGLVAGPASAAWCTWIATGRHNMVREGSAGSEAGAGFEDDVGMEVVGMAAAHVEGAPAGEEGPRSGEIWGTVDVVYVVSPWRRAGIGTALFRTATDWLASRGCSGVDCLVLPGDRPVKSFLEGMGLRARLIVMHASLPSLGPDGRPLLRTKGA